MGRPFLLRGLWMQRVFLARQPLIRSSRARRRIGPATCASTGSARAVRGYIHNPPTNTKKGDPLQVALWCYFRFVSLTVLAIQLAKLRFKFSDSAACQ